MEEGKDYSKEVIRDDSGPQGAKDFDMEERLKEIAAICKERGVKQYLFIGICTEGVIDDPAVDGETFQSNRLNITDNRIVSVLFRNMRLFQEQVMEKRIELTDRFFGGKGHGKG